MVKILVVDDSETLRRKLFKELSDGGYDVLEATEMNLRRQQPFC